MSNDRLMQVRRRHLWYMMTENPEQKQAVCCECWELWPCDAVAMADEVERLEEERDQAVEVAAQRGVEIAKLQAELLEVNK